MGYPCVDQSNDPHKEINNLEQTSLNEDIPKEFLRDTTVKYTTTS